MSNEKTQKFNNLSDLGSIKVEFEKKVAPVVESKEVKESPKQEQAEITPNLNKLDVDTQNEIKKHSEKIDSLSTKTNKAMLEMGAKDKRGETIILKNEDSIIDIYKDKRNKEKERETIKATSKLVRGIFNQKKNKIDATATEKIGTIKEIAELLKNNKINQIIIHAKENVEPGLEKGLSFQEDLDTRTALLLLNDYNKKNVKEAYEENAVTSLIPKGGSEENLTEKRSGIRIFLDVGGSHLRIEKGDETTTIRIDHHGAGQTKPTSVAKMVYEILQKADLLKEKPEWLNKFVNFVNEVDNLTYLENKDSKGRKVFNENYFRNEWPDSLHGIVEKGFSYETLIELCKSGKIKDPSVPFTAEELNSELGKTKVGKFTIKELCEQQKKNVKFTLETGIRNAIKYAKLNGLNLDTKSLGKIIYHNYPKFPQKTTNKILNHLAFKATKAKGYDTFVSWNPKNKIFFFNSFHPNLSKIVEKLNEADNGCALDIRGTMVYGKINNLTEEQFLNIIDPKILENTNSFFNKKTPKLKKENKKEKVQEISSESYQSMVNDLEMINKSIQNSEGIITLEEADFKSKYGKKLYKNLKSMPEGKNITFNKTELETIGGRLEKYLMTPKPKEEKKKEEVTEVKQINISEETEPETKKELTKEEILIQEKKEILKNLLVEIESDKKEFAKFSAEIERRKKVKETAKQVTIFATNADDGETLEEKPTENKETERIKIEKRREEELSATVIDESEVKKMVDRMLGNDKKNKYEKESQIKYTFEDNLVNGLANESITQIIKETGKRSSLRESMYWLTSMTNYVTVVEKGKELRLINHKKYESLIKKFQKAKSIVEKEVNEYINKINTKYNAELAGLESGELTEAEKKVRVSLEKIYANKEEPGTTPVETKDKITESQSETKEKKPFYFNTEFIKKRINNLLLSVEKINSVEKLEVKGKGDQIIINAFVVSSGFDIKVEATVENKGNSIAVKDDYKIKANVLVKGKVKKAIIPNLGKISELLKSEIEKEAGTKIEKIWIEDGELKAL